MLELFGLVETAAKHVSAGDTFGKLSVIAVGQIAGTYRYFSVCQCSCGSPVKRIRSDGLVSGTSQSCGCLHKEKIRTHGLTGHIHYSRWVNMHRRCYNPEDSAYKSYGGRGITVCEAWQDVAVFVAQLPDGYSDGAEIDRINNDGNYEPGNIRWSTTKQNCGNRRSAKLLTFDGRTQSQREWAREIGVPDQMIHDRLTKLGWSVDKALSEPTMSVMEVAKAASKKRWAEHDTKGRPLPKTARRVLFVEHDGQQLTLAQLSAVVGIKVKSLYSRIVELKWPVSRAIIQ